MDVQGYVLNKLLDKYESSKAFKVGQSTRRIIFDVKKEPKVVENNNEFVDAIKELADKELVTFDYEPHFHGNIEKVYLNIENLDAVYKATKRESKQNKLDKASTLLKEALDTLPKGDIKEYLETIYADVVDDKKLPQYNEKLGPILKVLEFIASSTDEITERVLSTKLFNDSKYLELNIKTELITILANIAGERRETLLEERGIIRYPELIEFTGDLTLFLKDGESINFAPLTCGAYINSTLVPNIVRVESTAKKVLFIENKANYYHYIKTRKEDELVIFHGGFFSPVKGQFFHLLSTLPAESFSHWSDIDLGGFKIFNRLKSDIFPVLKPYKMDTETLSSNAQNAKKIEDGKYLEWLKQLLNDPSYSVFYSTIRYMLDKKVKLEQESLLLC